MIGMVGNHLLAKMNLSEHLQKNINSLVSGTAVIYFQTKRNDRLGLYGNEPSPQIRINKGSKIRRIDQILLPSTIHNNFLNSYFTQW